MNMRKNGSTSMASQHGVQHFGILVRDAQQPAMPEHKLLYMYLGVHNTFSVHNTNSLLRMVQEFLQSLDLACVLLENDVRQVLTAYVGISPEVAKKPQFF